jgi:MoxR-like ATPase
MAEIQFLSGPCEGKRFQISDRPVVLGRSPDADIPIADQAASGRHAELASVDGRWRIRDLDSSNGVVVNGEEVAEAWLAPGDVVMIGASQFVMHVDSLPEPEVEAAAESDDLGLVRQMRERTDRIRLEVGKVIVGQREVLDQVLMCMIAGGHALLIGLPGMAKTLLVRTIAQVLDLKFKRVQFTPDLMPTDIIGTDVLETNPETQQKEFRFLPGPIFCNLLLADEINRTPPKTQAALLEAMQEKMVTAGTESYVLDEPFFVLATQNPIEQEGTYPLPEAQLDRFMFNIWVDYPAAHEEEEILRATTAGKRADPQPVLTKQDILQLQEVVRKVPVSDHVIKYVTRLVGATRPVNDGAPEVTKKFVSTGAGPRAGQYLILAAKATAILEGRIHISCSDIRRAAPPVLRHRILTNFAADSEGMTSLEIVKKLLAEVPEPGAEAYPAPGEAKEKDRRKPPKTTRVA